MAKKTTAKKTSPRYWVGVGASAGGLEALRAFAASLPSKGNATYIIAQHLSPQHRSMMVDLIGREISMPVREAQNGMAPEADTIYITPPNNDISVEGGKLCLRKPPKGAVPKPSVDLFFTTLAEELGECAIGIVLSGTGSDGAHGIRAIRAAGGLTLAQDKDTAKYHSMPRAAIDTGCVDLILKPDEMGKRLSEFFTSPQKEIFRENEEFAANSIGELLSLLRKHSGVDFTDYKPTTLRRRIERRMIASGRTQIGDYIGYVRGNPEELSHLFNDILISVTSFFRDEDAFAELRKAVKNIVSRHTGPEKMRVWVAGCATGEEAYSIAILFCEELAARGKIYEHNVQIFASDIDSGAMNIARKGIYPETALRFVEDSIRKKYFIQHGASYEVIKPLRDMVLFARHNVTEDPPFLRIDLISCRNLLIYFNAKLQQNALNLFHYSLKQSGILLLGKSESLGDIANLFDPVHAKVKLYRRLNAVSHRHQPPVIRPARLISSRETDKENPASRQLSDGIVNALAPNSVLINERLDIKRIYGDVGEYFHLAAGDAEMNVLALGRDSYKQEIRALMLRAAREQVAAVSPPHRIKTEQGHTQVRVAVRPILTTQELEKLYLLSFETVEETESKADAISSEGPRWRELEQELSVTKEHLQTVIEELETSNEELQSVNEELQSTNEELQSSNEELETSNEELQSTNEELTTVNEELQVKTAELAGANEDLSNIKNSIDFPIILVDADLRVRRFNRITTSIFDISETDKNYALTSVPSKIPLPDLRRNVQRVIESKKPVTIQIDDAQKSYGLRITPYAGGSAGFKGAVLTFVDNTEIRHGLLRLQESEKRFKDILAHSAALIYVKSLDGSYMVVNPAFLSLTGKTEEQIIGKRDHHIFPAESATFYQNDQKALATLQTLHVEDRVRVGDRHYTYLSIKYPVFDAEKRVYGICSVCTDITERRKSEDQLRLFKMMIENTNDMVVLTEAADLFGGGPRIVYVNGAFERVTGYKAQDVIGKTPHFMQESNRIELNKLREALQRKETFRGELINYARDGKEFWIELSMIPIPDEKGSITHFAAIQRDISDRKRAEGLRRAAEKQLF